MADKVLFSRSVDLVPVRKGVYKNPIDDTTGFMLLITPDEPVDPNDVSKGCKPKRRRKWGEDDEYDTVMRNFGMEGSPGEDVEQQLVFGFANVTVNEDGSLPIDWQGDMIETDVLEAAAYNFVLNHGMADQNHDWGRACGWLVESIMFTKEKMRAIGIPEGTVPEGWFVGFYIPDPDVFKKVKNGEYNMFSIGGTAQRIPIDQYFSGK